MHSPSPTPRAADRNARQRWMRAFALGDERLLEKGLASLSGCPPYTFLRRPEAGMVMLEGRTGRAGRRFNLGEMLVTRCAVRMATTDGELAGYAWVAGNRPRHAEAAAVLDALMQRPEYARHLDEALLKPLLAARRRKLDSAAAETARTKVDFFTLVRGEDA